MIHLSNPPTQPKANNGLSKRLAAFFEANPDEFLTYADICLKFDCDEGQAKNAVQYLARSGMLENVYVVRRKDDNA